jgi:hypothetical protein
MEGKRKKSIRRKLIRGLFWGSVFLVLMGGILWSFRSYLGTSTIKFAVAQSGTITHERKVVAIFANQELPILAPLSGTVQYMGVDGQRFRRGETVATIQAGGAAPGAQQQVQAATQAIQAGMGGLFFRQSDGLESVVTSDNLISMDLNKLLALKSNVRSSGAAVQTGEVIGVLVNNLLPTQAFLELPSIDGLDVGKSLRLTVGTQTVNAKILRKSDKPKGVIVQFPNYVDGSAAKRLQDVTWIYLPPTSGVLVPKSALWTQGEELGIFLWSEGVVHFKRVKVLDQDDNQACIEDLPSGIPVVTTPRDGLEGLVANVKNI